MHQVPDSECANQRDGNHQFVVAFAEHETGPDKKSGCRGDKAEWAQCERNAFNPARDPDAAKARLELLLETYPDSEVAAEAADELAALEG